MASGSADAIYCNNISELLKLESIIASDVYFGSFTNRASPQLFATGKPEGFSTGLRLKKTASELRDRCDQGTEEVGFLLTAILQF